MGLGAWGTLLDRVTSWLPIQSRQERWKNKIDILEKEKATLLKGKCDAKKAARLDTINRELDKLHGLCKNAIKG